MTQLVGIKSVSDWHSEDHETAGDHAPCLKVTSSFWHQASIGGDPTNYIVGSITAQNTGNSDLKNIKVYLVFEETSATADVVQVDSSGHIIEPPPGQTANFISIGDLAAGQSSPRKQYWWAIRRRIPNLDPTTPFEAKVSMSPQFEVSYPRYDLWSSVTNVS